MRYPTFLPKGGTIGFIAPSFGCAIEPYKTRFENAIRLFREMGYNLYFGPNCYAAEGLGISNTPEKCGKELNEIMTMGRCEYEGSNELRTEGISVSDDMTADAVITCGGGELMVEVVPYIDFEAIKNSEPKWYMGYSDNSNFTFLSAILADTAAIYGPCAPAFGREPWHKSVEDALKLLSGEIDEVHSYDLWERYDWSEEEQDSESEDEDEHEHEHDIEVDPLLPYHVTEKPEYFYYIPENNTVDKNIADKIIIDKNTTGNNDSSISMSGRLLGGCVDILTLHVGTKYDKVDDFLEKYKDDGFIWYLECCDLDPLSMRRAYWQMREAGWFKYAKGFLIGRPRRFGEEALGVDQYNAVTDILGELGVPIVMDLDIGHMPPMMPIINGAFAEVECAGNTVKMKYIYK